jgi:hypothetical protein
MIAVFTDRFCARCSVCSNPPGDDITYLLLLAFLFLLDLTSYNHLPMGAMMSVGMQSHKVPRINARPDGTEVDVPTHDNRANPVDIG